MWQCDACEESKLADQFGHGILQHTRNHDRLRVCKTCINLGTSPTDVDKYRCEECGDRGHTKFNKHELHKHKQTRVVKKMVCSDCISRKSSIEKTLRESPP